MASVGLLCRMCFICAVCFYFGSDYISISKCGAKTVSQDGLPIGSHNDNGSLMKKSPQTCDGTGLEPCPDSGTGMSISSMVKPNKTCDAGLAHDRLTKYLKKETQVMRCIAVVFLILFFSCLIASAYVDNIIPETQKWYDIVRSPEYQGQYGVLIAALKVQINHVKILFKINVVVCLTFCLNPFVYATCSSLQQDISAFFVPLTCSLEEMERHTDADISCYIRHQHFVSDYFNFLDKLCLIMSVVSSFYVIDLYEKYKAYTEAYRDWAVRPEPVGRNSVRPTFCEYLLIQHFEATDNIHLADFVRNNINSCSILQ